MNRRHFLASASILAATRYGTLPGMAMTTVVKGSGTISHVGGDPMMARYRLTRDRILHGTAPAYTPEFLLEDIHGTPGRRFTNFSGDVSGRWIGALATASAVYGEHFEQLDDVVRRVIALQHSDGYFGKDFHFDNPTDDDLALLWGNGRLLVGLMEYYSLTQDKATLASARKLGDFLVSLGPKYNSKQMADEFDAAHFASSYICWTQQIEGLAALYAVTKDARYRDLCADISAQMQRRPGDHVHGYLCSLRGTVDLYNATEETKYLLRVETAWQDIMQSGDVLLTGGVPEAWSPKKQRTEGCAECDWLRLNLALWKATGKSQYLDMAERTLFNEFSMNQFATGDFGHAVLTWQGIPQQMTVRAWWCCTFHGMRAFPDVTRSVFRTNGDDLFYDLPIDGTFTTGSTLLVATSTPAVDTSVEITVLKAEGQTLHVRRPHWATSVRLMRNDVAVPALKIASLRAGDVISVNYGMELQTQPAGETNSLADLKAFQYGPWLVGAALEKSPVFFNEMQAKNIVLTDSAHTAKETMSSAFDVPVAATAVQFLPAEYPEQPQQVVLHAIAEQTSIRSTPWQLAFHTKRETA